MKKRVCCIFNTPAHYCKSICGLIDKEFDCKFVFGDDAPSVKKFDTSILHDCSHIHYRYYKRILYVPGLLKYALKPYDCFIINPSTNNVSMWLFLLTLKFLPRKKVYTWTHGMYGNETKRQFLFKKLQNIMCDGEFVYGDRAIRIMRDKGFDSGKLFPIHNSLDYDSQLALRSESLKSDLYCNHFGNSNPVILMIGRLNRRKKLPMLIEAANLLKKRGLSINMVFIGEGEDRTFIENSAKEKNLLPQLWLYGACYNEEENAKLIYNADICVMPGDVGLTAIHSLMFGLPVITHDCFPNHGPEFEVVKPGVTGNFFNSDNVDSLAECIMQWLQSGLDRDEIRKACYEIIDKEWNPNYQLGILKSVIA